MIAKDKATQKAFFVIEKSVDECLLCCFYKDREIVKYLLSRSHKLIVKPHERYILTSTYQEVKNDSKEGFTMQFLNGKKIVEVPKKYYLFERCEKDIIRIKLSFLKFAYYTLKYYFNIAIKNKDCTFLPYYDYIDNIKLKIINSQQDGFLANKINKIKNGETL